MRRDIFQPDPRLQRPQQGRGAKSSASSSTATTATLPTYPAPNQTTSTAQWAALLNDEAIPNPIPPAPQSTVPLSRSGAMPCGGVCGATRRAPCKGRTAGDVGTTSQGLTLTLARSALHPRLKLFSRESHRGICTLSADTGLRGGWWRVQCYWWADEEQVFIEWGDAGLSIPNAFSAAKN